MTEQTFSPERLGAVVLDTSASSKAGSREYRLMRPGRTHRVGIWAAAFAAVFAIGSHIGYAASEPLAKGYTISFDRSKYVVNGGDTFPVNVAISPVPTNGLYSFGIRLTIEPTNAVIRGVGAISVPGDLAFDGPKGVVPVIAVRSNSAGVKGTAEFHSTNLTVATNAILATFLVTDLGSKPYTLLLGFFNTLGPTEEIFVDGAGQVLDPQITFGVATVSRAAPAGVVEFATNSAVTLNRQTGLFEQVVRIRNNRPAAIHGVRLFVTDLPQTWAVRNASGDTNGIPYLDYPFSLASGEFVDLRIEYRIPARTPNAEPGYAVQALDDPLEPPSPSGEFFTISPRATLPDGSFLLEFNSLANRSYSIQYSHDLLSWRTVVPSLQGNGSRIQWIDYGPPKTESHPSTKEERFYRVFLLP